MQSICTTNGFRVFVDDDVFEWVKSVSWYGQRHKNGLVYAHNRVRGAMHRLIMGVTARHVPIDHHDRNGLNNVRENLRVATHAQNLWNARRSCRNTSGFKGVSFDSRTKSYAARCQIEGKNRHLGRFKTALEAHEAYKAAAIAHRGELPATELRITVRGYYSNQLRICSRCRRLPSHAANGSSHAACGDRALPSGSGLGRLTSKGDEGPSGEVAPQHQREDGVAGHALEARVVRNAAGAVCLA
jgi:hypothetical protein